MTNLLKPLETVVIFGTTKARLYEPTVPMTYGEIVTEAKKMGIYKEWKRKYAQKLIDRVDLTPDVWRNQGPIHYTFTPIKVSKKKCICLDTWHPTRHEGKLASTGSSKREMDTTDVWKKDFGAAFLFRYTE